MSESKATDANQAPNEKYGHGDEPSMVVSASHDGQVPSRINFAPPQLDQEQADVPEPDERDYSSSKRLAQEDIRQREADEMEPARDPQYKTSNNLEVE